MYNVVEKEKRGEREMHIMHLNLMSSRKTFFFIFSYSLCSSGILSGSFSYAKNHGSRKIIVHLRSIRDV